MPLIIKPTIWENFFGASHKDMVIVLYILTCPESRLEGPFAFNKANIANACKLSEYKVDHCRETFFCRIDWVVSGKLIDINTEWTKRVVVCR